jgi:large subunit ribosomal protein L31
VSSSLRRDTLKQHPNMHLIDVRCSSCGASFGIRSTAEAISVDVCSNCHPAYTGRERAVGGSGRVERFNRRLALAAS